MDRQVPDPAKAVAHARARHFVILLGWVSLFADLPTIPGEPPIDCLHEQLERLGLAHAVAV
jgi:hypothetical protein